MYAIETFLNVCGGGGNSSVPDTLDLNGKAGDLAYEAQGYGFGAQDLTQYLGAVMSGLID